MNNIQFEELERRVHVIKLKSYLKRSVFILLLCSIIFLGYKYILTNRETKTEVIQEEHKKVEAPKQIKKVEVKVMKIEPKKSIKKILSIEKKPLYETIKLSPTITIPHEEIVDIEVEEDVAAKEDVAAEIDVVVEPKRKKNFSFQVREVKSEEALLERFKTAHDFESAVALANLYFEKQKYKKSIEWSKKASKLNPDDEVAWIIFAKSKYALGDKNGALRSLKLYLGYYSSDEAQKLLRLYKGKK